MHAIVIAHSYGFIISLVGAMKYVDWFCKQITATVNNIVSKNAGTLISVIKRTHCSFLSIGAYQLINQSINQSIILLMCQVDLACIYLN